MQCSRWFSPNPRQASHFPPGHRVPAGTLAASPFPQAHPNARLWREASDRNTHRSRSLHGSCSLHCCDSCEAFSALTQFSHPCKAMKSISAADISQVQSEGKALYLHIRGSTMASLQYEEWWQHSLSPTKAHFDTVEK